MHCIKKIKNDLYWVGANDRRLAMFEGVYSVSGGVSYNSFLLTDEKTVLFDTADRAVQQRFMENVAFALDGRKLDYIVVQHMEPDHCAALGEIIAKYPGVKIVCNEKTLTFIKQFFNLNFDYNNDTVIVKENDTLKTGRHTLNFIMAPMVHWPEVMVTYDSKDKILFSADAFGTFGALNGALFADEIDFEKDYLDEYRRYYTNIAGKYGDQVQSLLEKASQLDIEMICPLHGFLWRKNFSGILSKYTLWSSYQPEEKGVMIAYASVYGNTENASEILACRLREMNIKTAMFDVSVTPASEIIAAAFRWSHLVFASTTYNAGIFISMDDLINDLVAHNIQNRTVAVIENGSWAAASGDLIREKLRACNKIKILKQTLSLKSSLKEGQLPEIEEIAKAIAADFPSKENNASIEPAPGKQSAVSLVDPNAMFKISYGLFVLTAKEGGKDNGCIINTAIQITASPLRISVTVNKANLTCDMILKTGEFNLSILSESAPFSIFKQFGFCSGRDTDKFAQNGHIDRAGNGIGYIKENANCVISAKVSASYDYGTHTIFTADVTQSVILSDERSMTYQYYFDNIKPKAQPSKESKKGFVCKICGYFHEGDSLPDDFICPLCKHGAQDFEPV
ncbi:MAG: flavin reductase [Treponema sp.]|jgi:flavorubredoxin/flavin reductase (DIM6/NTAB) family NADH-FMN oxidoreductase RutF|nr:flavin reductase [Treponema sp.]